MAWKLYLGVIGFVVVFSAYYQLLITQNYKILDLVNISANFLLLFGGYCYIFKKKLLSANSWQIIFKILLGILGFNLIYQVWPSNYVGNFSLLNGSLLTNVFVFTFVTSFFIPLYLAIHRLGLNKNPKNK